MATSFVAKPASAAREQWCASKLDACKVSPPLSLVNSMTLLIHYTCAVQMYFDRYDLDESGALHTSSPSYHLLIHLAGTINSGEEMRFLTINLVKANDVENLGIKEVGSV